MEQIVYIIGCIWKSKPEDWADIIAQHRKDGHAVYVLQYNDLFELEKSFSSDFDALRSVFKNEIKVLGLSEDIIWMKFSVASDDATFINQSPCNGKTFK